MNHKTATGCIHEIIGLFPVYFQCLRNHKCICNTGSFWSILGSWIYFFLSSLNVICNEIIHQLQRQIFFWYLVTNTDQTLQSEKIIRKVAPKERRWMISMQLKEIYTLWRGNKYLRQDFNVESRRKRQLYFSYSYPNLEAQSRKKDADRNPGE